MSETMIRERLAGLFTADVLAALDAYIEERVAAALATQAPATNGTSPWLTVEQAAARLGCSTDAVRMRTKGGRLETRRDGRRVSLRSVDRLA